MAARITVFGLGMALLLVSWCAPVALTTLNQPSIDFGGARKRLLLAEAMRTEAVSSTENASAHFDAVIGSLQSGLGADTPSQLAPWLTMIETARKRETSIAHPERGLAADPDVAAGLVGAVRTLDLLEAKAVPVAVDVIPGLPWTAVGWMGLFAVVVAAVSGLVSARRFGRERDRLYEILGLPAQPVLAPAIDAVAAVVIRQTASLPLRPAVEKTVHRSEARSALVEFAETHPQRTRGQLLDVTPILDEDC